MFIDTLKKCATIAFFTNITITVISTFVLSYFKLSSNPLAGGAALGFGISIAIFVLLSFFFDLKERSGAKE
jgi:polyferredoxin